MTDPLDIRKLLDWLEGRLPEEEMKAIAAAIQVDEPRQELITWLRAFLDLSQSTVLVDPPDELVRQATAYFRAYAQGKREPGWVQRLVGRLTSDSWQRPSLVGVRHTRLDAAPRQLVYTAETADIVLNTQVGTARDTFGLIGQVFPTDGADPASFIVQVLQQELEVALSCTNEVGKFACTGLPDSVYTIIVRGDRAEITIADVELSS